MNQSNTVLAATAAGLGIGYACRGFAAAAPAAATATEGPAAYFFLIFGPLLGPRFHQKQVHFGWSWAETCAVNCVKLCEIGSVVEPLALPGRTGKPHKHSLLPPSLLPSFVGHFPTPTALYVACDRTGLF